MEKLIDLSFSELLALKANFQEDISSIWERYSGEHSLQLKELETVNKCRDHIVKLDAAIEQKVNFLIID